MFSVSNAALETFLDGPVGRAPLPAASAQGGAKRLRTTHRISMKDVRLSVAHLCEPLLARTPT